MCSRGTKLCLHWRFRRVSWQQKEISPKSPVPWLSSPQPQRLQCPCKGFHYDHKRKKFWREIVNPKRWVSESRVACLALILIGWYNFITRDSQECTLHSIFYFINLQNFCLPQRLLYLRFNDLGSKIKVSCLSFHWLEMAYNMIGGRHILGWRTEMLSGSTISIRPITVQQYCYIWFLALGQDHNGTLVFPLCKVCLML